MGSTKFAVVKVAVANGVVTCEPDWVHLLDVALGGRARVEALEIHARRATRFTLQHRPGRPSTGGFYGGCAVGF